MCRSTIYPTPGFGVYRPTNVLPATAPTWGPNPQSPNYIWNAAFRLLTVPPPGACCAPDGTCSVLNSTACEQAAGTFRGANTTCATSPCTGACCSPAGTCSVQTPNACAAADGLFGGFGSACGTCRTPGACCMPDGTCTTNAFYQCDRTDGSIYRGDGTSCPDTCLQTGACCRM